MEQRCCTNLVTVLLDDGDSDSEKYEAWYEGEIKCPDTDDSDEGIISQGFGRYFKRYEFQPDDGIGYDFVKLWIV